MDRLRSQQWERPDEKICEESRKSVREWERDADPEGRVGFFFGGRLLQRKTFSHDL